MRKFSVVVNGTNFVVEVGELENGEPAPAPAPAPVPSAAPAPAPAPVSAPAAPPQAGADGKILSPMPGTVLQVYVKEGQSVHAGDVLLMFEAMKMENEIMAPADGTVKKICVAVGSTIETGDELIVM